MSYKTKAEQIRELYDSGVTSPTKILNKLKEKGIQTSRQNVADVINTYKKRKASGKPLRAKKAAHIPKPLDAQTKKDAEAVLHPATAEEPKIGLEAVTVAEASAIPINTAAPIDGIGNPTPSAGFAPTVGGAEPIAETFSAEDVAALISTLNNMPNNPRYQIQDNTIPLLGKMWARIINKRLADVQNPNMDIYLAAGVTLIAVSQPVANYIRDKTAKKRDKNRLPDSKMEKIMEQTGQPLEIPLENVELEVPT